MATGESSPFSPIEQILDELRRGELIILVDDEDRENEGDLICAAEAITPAKVNFMLQYGRGTLCVALSRARCERLNLQPQCAVNTTRFGTAFTITIDGAAHLGVTTGVSTSDRASTIRQTVAEEAVPEDFSRPGHVNPLIASDGGVLVRSGQTEGSIDLCRAAGLMPGAALIEILNDDGTMARVPQLTEFSRRHGIKMCTVADLIEYRLLRERLIERVEAVPISNVFGDWLLIAYRSKADSGTHLALCKGGIGQSDDTGVVPPVDEPTLVRVHSECLTGDVFGSHRCECGEQLLAAMDMINREGRGALVYLRQEGRGIGLVNKLHAYRLQDEGLDTVEANEALGLPVDRRDYGVGAQILRDIGLSKVRILTNNPKKTRRLEVYGLHVAEQLPLEMPPNDHNRRYLETKKYKLGHNLRSV
ncbi:MAG: GTP cyclohydrolase II [Planctomycetes bacterium]|nr:GTP cyclohydrolase II [Planctomycetota bacterium]